MIFVRQGSLLLRLVVLGASNRFLFNRMLPLLLVESLIFGIKLDLVLMEQT